MFVPDKHFKPSLMFTSKAGAEVSGAPLTGPALRYARGLTPQTLDQAKGACHEQGL